MPTFVFPKSRVILTREHQPAVIRSFITELRRQRQALKPIIIAKNPYDLVHSQWHSQQSFVQMLVAIAATQGAVTAAAATDLCPYGDFTFPANWFQIGTHLRITVYGIITTTTGSNTMTFAVQLGATVINAAFGAITFIASQTNQKFKLVIDVECRALGNGTVTQFLCQGIFECSPALLAATMQMLPASGAATLGTGVDWTATQKLALFGTWSAINNSLTVEQYYVEQLN